MNPRIAAALAAMASGNPDRRLGQRLLGSIGGLQVTGTIRYGKPTAQDLEADRQRAKARQRAHHANDHPPKATYHDHPWAPSGE